MCRYIVLTLFILFVAYIMTVLENRSTEIVIKCNWTIKDTPEAKYIETNSKAKFKFVVESAQACINSEMNCRVSKIFIQWCFVSNAFLFQFTDLNADSVYDLYDLYKIGNYEVKNVSDVNIFLNICGPLRMNTKNYCTGV